MKRLKLAFKLLFFIFAATFSAFASATTINAFAVSSPVPMLDGIATSKEAIWSLAISAVTPIVVWIIKTIAPKIPKPLLPTITPFLGIGLGLLLNKLSLANLSWFDMAQAGALAVCVREVVNQCITKQIAADDPADAVKPA